MHNALITPDKFTFEKFITFFLPLGITFSETRKNMLASLATTNFPVSSIFVCINDYHLYMK